MTLRLEENRGKMKSKYNIPIIKPPRMKKSFPATLKLKNTENLNKSSNRTNITPDQEDEVSEEIKLSLAQQLDRLISE